MSIDVITEVKNPGEIKSYGVDFTNGLDTGDTISTQAVTVYETAILTDTSSTMLVSASTTKDGNVIAAQIQAGTAGTQYSLRFAATTVGGEVLYHIRKLKIKDERA